MCDLITNAAGSTSHYSLTSSAENLKADRCWVFTMPWLPVNHAAWIKRWTGTVVKAPLSECMLRWPGVSGKSACAEIEVSDPHFCAEPEIIAVPQWPSHFLDLEVKLFIPFPCISIYTAVTYNRIDHNAKFRVVLSLAIPASVYYFSLNSYYIILVHLLCVEVL